MVKQLELVLLPHVAEWNGCRVGDQVEGSRSTLGARTNTQPLLLITPRNLIDGQPTDHLLPSPLALH